MEIKADTTVNLVIGTKVFNLTRQEAENLVRQLQDALGHKPQAHLSLWNQHNIPPSALGPMVGTPFTG